MVVDRIPDCKRMRLDLPRGEVADLGVKRCELNLREREAPAEPVTVGLV